MFRVTAKGERLSQVQLTNYRAAITTNILLDDGVETMREFEMASELMGRKSLFTIPASEFARMDWPIEWMGLRSDHFSQSTRLCAHRDSVAVDDCRGAMHLYAHRLAQRGR